MDTNIREAIKMPTLISALGVASLKELNIKQRKAYKNIKYCANDQWQFVNSWYDQKDEDARTMMLDAEMLFRVIYSDSLANVYDYGSCSFGAGAASFLKDIRFCGKSFLQTVVLYYTAKLMEEAIPEVDGTQADIVTAIKDLLTIKQSIV